MNRYLVERDMRTAGNLSAGELRDLAREYCEVVREMRSGIEWVESYVTGTRLYCVYLAKNETLVREHSMRGGFPVTRVTQVSRMINPNSARATEESTLITRSSLTIPVNDALHPTVWRPSHPSAARINKPEG